MAMERNACVELLVSSAKRLKISSPTSQTCFAAQRRWSHRSYAVGLQRSHQAAIVSTRQTTRSASQVAVNKTSKQDQEFQDLRLPKNVQAVFLQPLRRTPTHGIPVCDLQIRSYSVRNLEAFTDFCMRAAYYLNLPAKGPVPLPRITERWTVPRSNFVHKKSQENFERVTVRRLIQIQDGHPETVAIWLAYIQKQRYYGVGMKACIFEHGKLDVVGDMDAEGKRIGSMLGEEWDLFGNHGEPLPEQDYNNALLDEPFKAQWGAYGAMGGIDHKSTGRQRFQRHRYSAEKSVGGARWSRAGGVTRTAKRADAPVAPSASQESVPTDGAASTLITETAAAPEAGAQAPTPGASSEPMTESASSSSQSSTTPAQDKPESPKE